MKITRLLALALVVATAGLVKTVVANDDTVKEKADRAYIDAKKKGREMRRETKKAVRDASGNESTYKDTKDKLKDGAANAGDEAGHLKDKLEN